MQLFAAELRVRKYAVPKHSGTEPISGLVFTPVRHAAGASRHLLGAGDLLQESIVGHVELILCGHLFFNAVVFRGNAGLLREFQRLSVDERFRCWGHFLKDGLSAGYGCRRGDQKKR